MRIHLPKPDHGAKPANIVAARRIWLALVLAGCGNDATGPAQVGDRGGAGGSNTDSSAAAPSTVAAGRSNSPLAPSTSSGGSGTSAEASRGGTTTLVVGGTGGATSRVESQGGRADSSSAKAAGGSVASGGTERRGTAAAGNAPIVGGSTSNSTAPQAFAGSSSTGGAGGSSTRTSFGTAGTVGNGGTSSVPPAITVYLAGDSIVSAYTDTSATNDQAGWGQMLPPLFNTKVTFVNRAAGGRTAYWFYLEGALEKILSTIKPGDYLFVEFGTNDQNTTATFEVNGKTYPRLAEPATFKTQLKQYYLDPVRAKGATPVLITPPPRNSAYCNGGNGLGAYATAMLELGAAENVVVIDNNAKTYAYVKAICPKPTTAETETFFFGKSDGSIDGTHFQENGARKMAGFIAEGVRASGLALASYLR